MCCFLPHKTWASTFTRIIKTIIYMHWSQDARSEVESVWMPGLKRKKIRKNLSPCPQGAHIPVQSQNPTKANKLQRPDIHWAPTRLQCFTFFTAFTFLQNGDCYEAYFYKWGHWIPKKLDPRSDCPKPIASLLLITLTSLPTRRNILTTISNQVKVLAPFKLQLKR